MADKTILDVQNIINNKADSKLKAAIREINNALYNGEGYQLLKDISVNIGTSEKPNVIAVSYLLSSSGLEGKIIENNTQRYREAEAVEFIKKVESIRDDVDYLLDNKNHD